MYAGLNDQIMPRPNTLSDYIISYRVGRQSVLPTFYHTNTHRVDYIIGIRQGRDQFVQAVGKYLNVQRNSNLPTDTLDYYS